MLYYAHLFSIAFLESLAMSTLTRALTLLWLAIDVIVFHPGEKGFKQQLCFFTRLENVVVLTWHLRKSNTSIHQLHSNGDPCLHQSLGYKGVFPTYGTLGEFLC